MPDLSKSRNKTPPILILHGWGSSAKRWIKVKQFLEGKGYSIFTPDLPGFGDEATPDRPWSVTDYVQWVKIYAEKNNLASFILVGHSFGGGIAATFAATYPEKVVKLVLVCPAIRRFRTLKRTAFFCLSKLGNIFFAILPFSYWRDLARRILYRCIGAYDYYRLTRQQNSIMIATFKKIIDEDLSLYLPKINAPTLILWGERDKVTPVGDTHFLKDKIINSRLKIIPEQNHDLNLKAPKELAEEIAKFLQA